MERDASRMCARDGASGGVAGPPSCIDRNTSASGGGAHTRSATSLSSPSLLPPSSGTAVRSPGAGPGSAHIRAHRPAGRDDAHCFAPTRDKLPVSGRYRDSFDRAVAIVTQGLWWRGE